MNSPPYIDIQYNPNLQLVQCQWLRSLSSVEYRKGMQYVCSFIEKNPTVSWIIDATRLIAPNMSDQKWTSEILGHCISKVKLRKIALILPDDLFSEVVAEKINLKVMQMISDPIKIMCFNDFEKGMNWVLSNNETEGLFRDNITPYHEDASNSW